MVKKLGFDVTVAQQPEVLLLLCGQFLVLVLLLHSEVLFLSLLELNSIGLDRLDSVGDPFDTANLGVVRVLQILTVLLGLLSLFGVLFPLGRPRSLAAL